MRSPEKTLPIVLRYCFQSGSSKPQSSRIAAICSGVEFLPAMRAAGSPFGMTLKIRNVSTETANITSTIAMSRRTMNLAISVLQAHAGPGVECVAHALAEDVQRQDGQDEHEARGDRQERGAHDEPQSVADHRAPGRVRRLHAGAEERQRGLEQHRVRQQDREEDE